MKNKNGFTLIEIIIVIFIIILLIGVSIASYRSFEKSTELENAAQNIVSILKLAQTKTTASKQASQYGVHFENDKYILFKGGAYEPTSEDNKTYNISNRLEIYGINLSGESNDVIFQRINGRTEQNGAISIKIISNPTEFKTINIQSSGLIELSGAAECCEGNRLIDARHIHLNLGWSIQDSITLTLNFLDTPAVNYDIDMTDYFNEDKTEFNWSGIINVNGENQELQIHTHSLDAINTILCIHRPKDKNNKPLNVLIDSKSIISYEADGEVIIGAYGGTLEVQ